MESQITRITNLIHNLIRIGDIQQLKESLSGISNDTRSKILHHTVENKAALYIACEERNLEIIDYLINDCKVDIEQRGLYQHKHFHDQVPPLWCCTEKNYVDVVKLLISCGANINCTSSTNGTALLVGCLHNSDSCVKELIKAGAKVNTPNIYGATPLLNAASKASLDLCEFLINNGADVKFCDSNGRTTLHRAVEENRLEIVKLLFEKGCDCQLQNDFGDSALRLAALKGCHQIVEYLTENAPLDTEEIVDSYEILGSYDAEKDQFESAIKCWLKAFKLRALDSEHPVPKKLNSSLGKYTDHKELASIEEISQLSRKEELMIQSLLIRERILGISHSETIWALDYCGAIYADRGNYESCIRLWKCAFELLVGQKDNIGDDCTFRIQAIMKVFLDLIQENGHTKFPSQDLLDVFETLQSSVEYGSRMFEFRPREEHAPKRISIMMKMTLQLMNLTLKHTLGREELERLKKITKAVVKTGIHDEDGRTLLHMSMNEQTSITNEYTYSLFPSFKVLNLLVKAGANVNCMDNERNTVLHYCVNHAKKSRQIDTAVTDAVRYLLDHNAHADARNRAGESALDGLISTGCLLCPLDHFSLKCLAANVITKNSIAFKHCLPSSLFSFVEIHGVD